MEQEIVDENLKFLKEKINSIKVALFRSEIDSELKLPNNIIKTYKVEDDGTVWFFTTLNGYHKVLSGKPFFAHLYFHKKDADFHLQLSGKAVIVENADLESNFNTFSTGTYAVALIKMKILQAEFNEKEAGTNISWPKKIKSVFNHLFLAPHRIYRFT